MNIIWLCITSALSITAVVSDPSADTGHIRVFPTGKHSIAGVFQVSSLNDLSQPVYAFNASDARILCLTLGVVIASKDQVKDALARGLETCRFGWIDEHFAVIPRRKALSNCGQSQTGLVMWRASVTQKFDVFCFNETDAAAQLRDTTTDSPVTTGDISEITTIFSTLLPSSSSTPETLDSEAFPVVGSAQSSAGAKAVLISSICSVLLIAIIIIVYIKIRRTRSLDLKEQQDYLQTEEWTCVKTVKDTETAETAEEDERVEVDDNAS